MELLIKLSDRLDRLITRIAKVAAWAGLALIAVTIFDVVTRRFLVLGSTKLQELEWHFHVVLFALCLGFAYLKDSHVRIDLVRERLGERAQWWIDAHLGILEVGELAAEDANFKKTWESLQAFRAEYAIWKELGYLN